MPGLTADNMAIAKYTPRRISFGQFLLLPQFSNPNKVLVLAELFASTKPNHVLCFEDYICISSQSVFIHIPIAY